MRTRLFGLIVAGASCLAAAAPAHAIICYLVYDRNENVIYQNTYPPVDMSSAGTAARDAMRARGEHLTFGDSVSCPTLVFLADSGSGGGLNLDEVLVGMPAHGSTEIAGVGKASGVASRGAAPAPKASKRAY